MAPPEDDWRRGVRVAPAPSVVADLTARLGAEAATTPIPVTDLLDLRPAFFRGRSFAPASPERRARQEAGRRLHTALGRALAAPRFLEVRLRRSGLVGQVDLLEEIPTELKTTHALPEGDLRASRPAYLDQLGMYCALADRAEGRLVLVEVDDGTPGACRVVRVRFGGTEEVLAAMVGRADRLRAAEAAGSAKGLPRCAWFGRGCEFQTARACDCTGAEPEAPAVAADAVTAIELDTARTEALRARLPEVARSLERPVVARFRDLLYPRRAYFERTEPAEAEPAAPAPPSPGRRDLYRTVRDLLEAGPPGEASRRTPPTGEPAEAVPCFRDRPYLLKVTRVGRPWTAGTLAGGQPNYLLELGLRCAAVGAEAGWLVLAYERADDWPERLAVFEVRFAPGDGVAAVGSGRAAALARALATGRFEELLPCPGWMVAGCPYAARCGCGASPSAPGGPANRIR